MAVNAEIIIVDQFIRLEIANQRFAKALFSIIQRNQVHLSGFLAWPKHVNSMHDTVEFLNSSAASHYADDSKTYVIFYQGECSGIISFNVIDKPNKTADIGYWIAGDREGKGIVSASLNKLIEIYSNNNKIQRFIIKCAVKNTKSNALAIRNGFHFKGVLKQAEKINDEIFDQNIYTKEIPRYPVF